MCADCEAADYIASNISPSDDVNRNYTYPHPVYAAIFNNVLRETRHPALALQSHFTALYEAAYYEVLDRYNVFAPATTISFVQALRPVSLVFLIVVSAVLLVNLLVAVYVCLCFIREGTLSLLGNTWSCVAQIQVPEAVPWLRGARPKSDKEVEAMMREAGGTDKVRIRLTAHGVEGYDEF